MNIAEIPSQKSSETSGQQPNRHQQPQDGASRFTLLGIGIATLDVVNEVETYPAEDDEVRAGAQRIQPGGNCANTLSVLSALGHRCRWVGTLADDLGAAQLREGLEQRGLSLQDGKVIRGGTTPTSYITLSRTTGSRTIVHYRDLPELSAADFAQVDLNGLDWVHFEGRNPVDTQAMIERVVAEYPGLPISVEVEKPRPGIERLFRLPEDRPTLLIISRAFAEQRGTVAPESFLRAFAAQAAADLLLLPWGADGAYGLTRDGKDLFAPARPPKQVVDTLAAGDVFNAAAIDALLDGTEPSEVLTRANALAGRSCGQRGIDGLSRCAGGSRVNQAP